MSRSPSRRGLGPLPPDDRGEGRGDTSDQGLTVTVVLEALQLFVSLVSATLLESSAQATKK